MLAGASTGIAQAENTCSLWCATADERAPGSSPATTSTPPWREVPAKLAFLNTSPQRSTPGPLPYHIAKMPSRRGAGQQVQLLRAPDRGGGQILVDTRAESGCHARRGTASPRAARCRARPAANRGNPTRSRPCSGRRRCRAACCSIGSRASACTPVMKTGPCSRRYLSSSSNVGKLHCGSPWRVSQASHRSA